MIYTLHVFQGSVTPILTVRLELIENLVAFRPPLDESTSNVSVQETVQKWLNSFLDRGNLVDMLGGKVCEIFSFFSIQWNSGPMVLH